jgi:PncC family amidohydrolase
MRKNLELVELLKKKGLTISTAESVTGGKLISAIIDIPGASNITEQSYIVYSNRAKVEVLGVRPETIDRFGVVSEEVAIEMARNLKRLTKSNVVVSTTGEAGPSLGSEGVQVGTVCIGIIIDSKEYIYKKFFTEDRIGIIDNAVTFIVNELIFKLV